MCGKTPLNGDLRYENSGPIDHKHDPWDDPHLQSSTFLHHDPAMSLEDEFSPSLDWLLRETLRENHRFHQEIRKFSFKPIQWHIQKREGTIYLRQMIGMKTRLGGFICEIAWIHIGGFPWPWRYPKMDAKTSGKSICKWMIWGYLHFRKPPYIHNYQKSTSWMIK